VEGCYCFRSAYCLSARQTTRNIEEVESVMCKVESKIQNVKNINLKF
jgi:hypothetical protein